MGREDDGEGAIGEVGEGRLEGAGCVWWCVGEGVEGEVRCAVGYANCVVQACNVGFLGDEGDGHLAR